MEKVTLTNRQIEGLHKALQILANRRMANLGADLKVARLLRAVQPLAEPLADAQRKFVLRAVEGRDVASLTPLAAQALQAEIGTAHAALAAETVECELPLAYALKEADLPKEQTGTDGWQNASQLGALICDLGPLYVLDPT